MEEMGKAMMGTGEASSEEDAEDRAVLAAERAISTRYWKTRQWQVRVACSSTSPAAKT